jgi:polysaccharide deacetylase family protein (PEP-CTERM system associated)
LTPSDRALPVPAGAAGRKNVLTVAVEDYFQVGSFNHLIQSRQWYRFETRIERNTLTALDLLDELGVRATFFVLGWVGDELPGVVREIVRRGHEVATKGYYHRSIRQMTREEFRDDLRRSRHALEQAGGRAVRGHRVAHEWFTEQDLWALDVLAEEGFVYDSSFCPLFRSFANEPWRRFLWTHRHQGRELYEFPLSTADFRGFSVPIAGGNYFRQFPHALMKRLVARHMQETTAPFVMYFHVWELDANQPRIATAPLLTRIRHYRNLGKMADVLRDHLRSYPFGSIADYLGLPDEPAERSVEGRAEAAQRAVETYELTTTDAGGAAVVRRIAALPEARDRLPVTVVIPCYNEELVLPYLANTLASVEEQLEKQYALRFLFVDDASVDGTWDALRRIFGGRPNCQLVRHPQNRGVAAGIMTGIRNAQTEIVCSIDCDCTYDPHQLANLIPLLSDDVAMVTASPYHALGQVVNVPGWRLSLSRGLSFLYRLVLRTKLATYTSCFRAYRRSAFEGLELSEGGFLGVAEMIGLLDRRGARIAEMPAVLEVRMLGRSKMKVLRTIAGHLRLWLRIAGWRLTGRKTTT